MNTRIDRDTTLPAWLAQAHEDPAGAHREWADRRLAKLPLGIRFDAVQIPADILHAALFNVRPAAVSPLLEQLLNGPVIQDDDRWIYPLVPVGGAIRWRSRAAKYLALGWLWVPQVDQLAPPGVHWSVPVREPGRLCDLVRVSELVEVGATRLANEALS